MKIGRYIILTVFVLLILMISAPVAAADTTPPEIVSTTPADGATNVGLDAKITIKVSEKFTFSPSIPGWDSESSIAVERILSDNKVATFMFSRRDAEIDMDDNAIILKNPELRFLPNTKYRIFIYHGALTDEDGNKNMEFFTTFTTGADETESVKYKKDITNTDEDPDESEPAGEKVEFTDSVLEDVIREKIDKPSGDLFESDVSKIKSLVAPSMGIKKLDGIEYLKGLVKLDLKYNRIEDVTPLSKLTKLNALYLMDNPIKDYGPLEKIYNTTLTNKDFTLDEMTELPPEILNREDDSQKGIIEWTEYTNGDNSEKSDSGVNVLYDILYVNGQFVAAGMNGNVKVSKDGRNWTTINTGTTMTLKSIIWDGKRFLAVSGKGTIVISEDLNKWMSVKSGTNEALNDICWNGTQYVAVGGKGTVVLSKDGVNWNISSLDDINFFCSSIAWSGSRYVVSGMINGYVNGVYTLVGKIYLSDDGITWVEKLRSENSNFNDAVWNGNKFVVLGDNGRVFSSADGLNWSEGLFDEYRIMFCITWDGRQFIAGGYDGRIQVSGDGDDWKVEDPTTKKRIFGIAWNGHKYVAVGEKGLILVGVVPGMEQEDDVTPDMNEILVPKPSESQQQTQDSEPSGIKVILNGVKLNYDVPPTNVGGRVMVPLRLTGEALGTTLDWDPQTSVVTGKRGNITFTLKKDDNVAVVNGNNVKLDVPAQIVNGRMLVPLRFLSESIDADVGWDENTNTVTINLK